MAALELLAGAARASRESNGLSVRKRQGAFGFLCSQSTEPTAPEEALVCFVLFNVGRFSLFRCVVMMFGLLHRSVLGIPRVQRIEFSEATAADDTAARMRATKDDGT